MNPMDLLLSNLCRVRIPESTNRIFKKECRVSFDTPGMPCPRKAVYRKKELKNSGGVEGGFDDNEGEYDETHNLVILSDYVTLQYPSVELPEKVRLTVDAVLMAEGAERKEQAAAWTADKKQISAYAMNLQQIENSVIVQPSVWQCVKCDKRENLWLILSDGMILCRRRNWDGSGCNNHAIEHYKETGYPFAVKLVTITADLEGAGNVSLMIGEHSSNIVLSVILCLLVISCILCYDLLDTSQN